MYARQKSICRITIILTGTADGTKIKIKAYRELI